MAAQSAQLLLEQLEAFNSSQQRVEDIPLQLRTRLANAMKTASGIVATPTDKVIEVMLEGPAESAAVNTACDLGIFSGIEKAKGPQTVAQLAATTQADPRLLTRLMRVLSAYGAAIEVGDAYDVPPAYQFFREREFETAYRFCAEFNEKIYFTLPEFLKKTGYKDLRDPLATVIQQVFNKPGEHPFQILAVDEGFRNHFSKILALWSDGWTPFTSLYPVQESIIDAYDSSKSDAVWVDVGGGWGQQTRKLRESFPAIQGRTVAQDLYAIAGAPKDDPAYKGVELMTYDFFTEQPIKGARIYFLRTVLHNWADEKYVEILERLRPALIRGYSKVLIMEAIMPEHNPGRWVALQDLQGGGVFAARERTVKDHEELLAKAGLKITNVYQDDNPANEGVVEAELA